MPVAVEHELWPSTNEAKMQRINFSFYLLSCSAMASLSLSHRREIFPRIERKFLVFLFNSWNHGRGKGHSSNEHRFTAETIHTKLNFMGELNVHKSFLLPLFMSFHEHATQKIADMQSKKLQMACMEILGTKSFTLKNVCIVAPRFCWSKKTFVFLSVHRQVCCCYQTVSQRSFCIPHEKVVRWFSIFIFLSYPKNNSILFVRLWPVLCNYKSFIEASLARSELIAKHCLV